MGLFRGRSAGALPEPASPPQSSRTPIPPQTVEYEVIYEYPYPSVVVWEQFERRSVPFDEDEVLGGRVEGTGPGHREIYVSVREGRGRRHVHASATVRYEEGRRRATVELAHFDRGKVSETNDRTVEPVDDKSCRVRLHSKSEWAIRPEDVPRYQQIFRERTLASLKRMSEVLQGNGASTPEPGAVSEPAPASGEEAVSEPATAAVTKPADVPSLTLECDVSFNYPYSADLVWAHLDDPSFGFAPVSFLAGRVESTPYGVGEVRLNLRTGSAGIWHVHTTETVAFEDGRHRALRELPNHHPGVTSLAWEYAIEPLTDSSCTVRYRSTTETRIAANEGPTAQRMLEESAHACLKQLLRTLDDNPKQ